MQNRFTELGSITEENRRIFGINSSIAFYLSLSTKFYFYGALNFGIGIADHQRFNVASITSNNVTYPVFTVAPAIGIHYFVTKNLTANFNLPLININYISYANTEKFKTIAPTVGIGLFF